MAEQGRNDQLPVSFNTSDHASKNELLVGLDTAEGITTDPLSVRLDTAKHGTTDALPVRLDTAENVMEDPVPVGLDKAKAVAAIGASAGRKAQRNVRVTRQAAEVSSRRMGLIMSCSCSRLIQISFSGRGKVRLCFLVTAMVRTCL
jgi:hypothetical protein